MASKVTYDPTEYGSDEEAARSRVAMDREFGMPREAYDPSGIGRRVNELHAQADADMNNEFGWGNTTPSQLRKRWGLE